MHRVLNTPKSPSANTFVHVVHVHSEATVEPYQRKSSYVSKVFALAHPLANKCMLHSALLDDEQGDVVIDFMATDVGIDLVADSLADAFGVVLPITADASTKTL